VGVVGADIMAFMPAHLLKSDPDIGLDVFDKMSEVDRAVGIGQGAGDEDFSWGHVLDGVSLVFRRKHWVLAPLSSKVKWLAILP
jgi:hypothetical protein